ncbi:hypothetical protein [Anaerosinus massiliensis]|uniref:hypothetical protein n=1 Tax=Massilibacillus massiliensis TaxID=1806837 RepID=UPI000AEB9A5C|nr:hypothetical protein [Massilibacillus massiliensis]
MGQLLNRLFKKNHLEVKMQEGDEAVLKQYPADFIAFSYYMSMVQSVHAAQQLMKG